MSGKKIPYFSQEGGRETQSISFLPVLLFNISQIYSFSFLSFTASLTRAAIISFPDSWQLAPHCFPVPNFYNPSSERFLLWLGINSKCFNIFECVENRGVLSCGLFSHFTLLFWETWERQFWSVSVSRMAWWPLIRLLLENVPCMLEKRFIYNYWVKHSMYISTNDVVQIFYCY